MQWNVIPYPKKNGSDQGPKMIGVDTFGLRLQKILTFKIVSFFAHSKIPLSSIKYVKTRKVYRVILMISSVEVNSPHPKLDTKYVFFGFVSKPCFSGSFIYVDIWNKLCKQIVCNNKYFVQYLNRSQCLPHSFIHDAPGVHLNDLPYPYPPKKRSPLRQKNVGVIIFDTLVDRKNKNFTLQNRLILVCCKGFSLDIKYPKPVKEYRQLIRIYTKTQETSRNVKNSLICRFRCRLSSI